jgi:hypothetical protein
MSSPQLPTSSPPFLDVPTLIDASVSQRPLGFMRYSFGIFLAIVIGGMWLAKEQAQYAGTIQAVSTMLLMGLLIAMGGMTFFAVRSQRREQFLLQRVEELMQLKQWPAAGVAVQGLLSRPVRNAWARVQGLIFLAGILARYHRFDDAIAVHDYLLENVNMDGGTAHSLQLGRAMAMLREDHLFDADRAISDLRKQAFRAAERRQNSEGEADVDEEGGDEAFAGSELAVEPPLEATMKPILTSVPRSQRTHASAGLALVELYRDVKTGHPVEAEKTFNENLPLLRQHLGHRLADAYVLVARAYDLMNRPADAAAMYVNATLLAPVKELNRRYPEVAVLASKYAVAAAPAAK